jgi:hypothetical protein
VISNGSWRMEREMGYLASIPIKKIIKLALSLGIGYLSEWFSGIGELGTLVTMVLSILYLRRVWSTFLDGDTYCSNDLYAALLKIIVNDAILI